jgi:hypothetical protein
VVGHCRGANDDNACPEPWQGGNQTKRFDTRKRCDGRLAARGNNLTRFRGRKVKTTGDGILATFDGPARGVRCACAISEETRPLGIEAAPASIPASVK